MLPAFVITNVTGPAATLACDSTTFHSDSFTFTVYATPGCGCGAAPSSATATTIPAQTPFDSRYIAAFLVKGCSLDSSLSDRARRVLIPPGILLPHTESLSGRLTAHPEDRLESSELERFEAVVLPHLDAAYTLARYLTRNDYDAQDIVQDASLRALRYFGSFRGTAVGEGRAWLLTIVRNTAYTWRQRHRGDTLTTEFDEERHSDTVADEHPEAVAEAQSE